MSLKGFATRLFAGFVDAYPQMFSFVRENLPKAGIKTPFRTYMSVVFLFTLVGFATTLAVVNVAFLIFPGFGSAFLRIAYSIFVPILVSVIIFLLLAFYPYQRVSSRRKSVEANLPFVLTHMGAIAQSGVPPYVIFKLISEFKDYGEISVEMEKIVRNIDRFGLDPISAMKEVADRTPSEDFRQMLYGVATTIESGGDIKSYLKGSGEQALFEWRIKREKFLQQLSAYAEFYTGILIAAPLFIIALFAVMNMIQPSIGGFDILFLTKASIYAIVPIVNITFLAFLRGVEVEI